MGSCAFPCSPTQPTRAPIQHRAVIEVFITFFGKHARTKVAAASASSRTRCARSASLVRSWCVHAFISKEWEKSEEDGEYTAGEIS